MNGSQSAWGDLVRSYQRLIYSVARVLCPEPADADDVFQQVCLELHQRLPEIRDIASLPKWLVTVTRRQSVNFVRARMRTSDVNENDLACASQIQAIERQHTLDRALRQMPDRCRRLLTHLSFSGEPVSYAEVAELMGMPIASIGPNRARCLKKLRAILGGPC
jgi:RNA polymerase sigma factor (sigma-70 family)